MFGPNALWHLLAGRVSEESGKRQEQQGRERARKRKRHRRKRALWVGIKKEAQKQRHKR